MKNFHRIAKYLEGGLSGEEKLSFEAEMAADQELAEEVKLQQFEEGALEWMARESLRQKIREHRDNQAAPKKDGSGRVAGLRYRPFLRVAAIAAGLMLAIAAYFILPSSPTPGQLADKYTPEGAPGTTLRSGQGQPGEELPESDSLYQLGHRYYREGRYREAIGQFNAYLRATPSSYRKVDEVEFFLVLAYLKNDEVEKAKTLAGRLSRDSTHRFQPMLKQLMKEL